MDHVHATGSDRRTFLRTTTASGALVLAGCRAVEPAGDREPAEVTPGEDLMQEHGVLERVLLVYDEAARRLQNLESLDPAVVRAAATIVRRFVEDYHEKLEEEHVFPRLEAARKEIAVVTTLRRQHERGRSVTDEIMKLGAASALDGARLASTLLAFGRMYRPHAAREDTVVFPAFRSLLSASGYRELGDQFEEQEHARVGEHGFETAVAEIARLETALGIDDLARFTPP